MNIEKGVPLKGLTEECRLILNNFEIGDSALLDSASIDGYVAILSKVKKEVGSSKKFKTKKWDKQNHRIWRIA